MSFDADDVRQEVALREVQTGVRGTRVLHRRKLERENEVFVRLEDAAEVAAIPASTLNMDLEGLPWLTREVAVRLASGWTREGIMEALVMSDKTLGGAIEEIVRWLLS